MDYMAKEAKIIGQINELLDALDITLSQIDDPANQAIGYDAQSRAIAQLEEVVKKENKLDKLYDQAREQAERVQGDYENRQAELEYQIRQELARLDETLSKLDVCDNKLQCFFEQKKAIHEIKKIVKAAERLEA